MSQLCLFYLNKHKAYGEVISRLWIMIPLIPVKLQKSSSRINNLVFFWSTRILSKNGWTFLKPISNSFGRGSNRPIPPWLFMHPFAGYLRVWSESWTYRFMVMNTINLPSSLEFRLVLDKNEHITRFLICKSITKFETSYDNCNKSRIFVFVMT